MADPTRETILHNSTVEASAVYKMMHIEHMARFLAGPGGVDQNGELNVPEGAFDVEPELKHIIVAAASFLSFEIQ